MKSNYIVLRELAMKLFEASAQQRNEERKKLHTSLNDLKMIRPVVLIDELPWSEFDGYDELKAVNTDPFLNSLETYMRRTLFKYRYFPADMIVQPYIPVHKCIEKSELGVSVEENTVATDAGNHIISHEYHDHFEEDDSIGIIKDVTVSYNKDETLRRFNLVGEILGDIMPIKIKGVDHLSVVTWDDISRYRGVTNLLIDLMDRPEFSHRLVERLTQIKESELSQFEALGLFDDSPDTLHCTPVLTNDLPKPVGDKVTRKEIWGRGTAQIFASVSKEMHYEFDIEYMKRTIGTCGLSYYGCCEPLDRKIDIVEKLGNVRKISITPWADVNIAAEAMGQKYVLAAKPNPAAVAVPILDKEVLKKEITNIISAAGRNGCPVELVLKDISSCHKRPENIFEWERTVMDIVKNS